jgi:hypothetical protein
MTSPLSPPEVLAAWHDAVNAGDVEGAVSRCSEGVAVAGPRGVGHGHDLVRGWLRRSGIRLTPQEDLVERDGRFVVHELAHWTTEDAPDAAPKEPTETWCVFTVADGKVTSIARFESAADIPPA